MSEWDFLALLPCQLHTSSSRFSPFSLFKTSTHDSVLSPPTSCPPCAAYFQHSKPTQSIPSSKAHFDRIESRLPLRLIFVLVPGNRKPCAHSPTPALETTSGRLRTVAFQVPNSKAHAQQCVLRCFFDSRPTMCVALLFRFTLHTRSIKQSPWTTCAHCSSPPCPEISIFATTSHISTTSPFPALGRTHCSIPSCTNHVFNMPLSHTCCQ